MSEHDTEFQQSLQDLDARIEERKKALAAARGALDNPLQSEWDQMLRRHAEIRRRLEDGKAKGSEAGAKLREDIDVLRHSFFRWVARVDDRYKSSR
jgi:chromosome segregation ATPase